jgi:Uma2 family endonuclease
MAVGTLVPLEEYLSTNYDPDCDWIDGELIERNMGEFDHAGLQGVVFAILYSQRREAGIHVFPELRMQVAPRRYRVPDIAVTKRRGKGILREPAFLCVEILSPQDRVPRIESRIGEYLAFGVPYVWMIDPRARKAWVYSSDGRREVTDALTTSNPVLRVRLDEIFSALDEDVES